MAKSKKSESKSESTSAPASKAKAPAKKAAAKAQPVSGSPMINTSLAAENAARMLMASRNRPTGTSNAPHQESAMFKQLKAGLNKSSSMTVSNLLDKSHGPEPAKGHPSMKQIGHNQTHSADVTRSGVPRRTPG